MEKMEKNVVVQEHELGCGLACVAFVVVKSYQEVLNITGNPSKATQSGYYCKELIGLLHKFKYTYEVKYIKPHIKKLIYTNDTIVFIKRSLRYPFGHYLVYHNGLWMDPWINFPKNNRIEKAKAGFRKRLPGKPIYALLKYS